MVTAIRMLYLDAAIHMIELYCARLQCKLHHFPEDHLGQCAQLAFSAQPASNSHSDTAVLPEVATAAEVSIPTNTI